MTDETPLLDELVKVRKELEENRRRLEEIEARFVSDARSPEDRAVTKYMEGKMREMKRGFNNRLKKLEVL